MLIKGKKGEELSQALKGIEERAPMDVHLVCPQPTRKYAKKPIREQRRSSSVPLPDDVGGPFFLPPPTNNAFLSGDRYEFGRRRSSSVDRYLPAPSGEVMFNNPFAPAPPTTAPQSRSSLSPISTVDELRPMDTSMFDPSFMKAAEQQRTFPVATTCYVDERVAPHEIPSSYIPIDPVLMQQSHTMAGEGAYSTQFTMPSIPTFQPDIPQQMFMAEHSQHGMENQDINELWKSFTVGKSFSLDNLTRHSQSERGTSNGWYTASASPEYSNMMATSSHSEYQNYEMPVFSNEQQMI